MSNHIERAKKLGILTDEDLTSPLSSFRISRAENILEKIEQEIESRAASRHEVDTHNRRMEKFGLKKFVLELGGRTFSVTADQIQPTVDEEKKQPSMVSRLEEARDNYLKFKYLPQQGGILSMAKIVNGCLLEAEIISH